MTVAMGLIPNEKEVMIMTDSMASWGSYEHGLVGKIREVEGPILVSFAGALFSAKDFLHKFAEEEKDTHDEIVMWAEECYRGMREEQLVGEELEKQGVSSLEEVTSRNSRLDEGLKKSLIAKVEKYDSSLTVVIAHYFPEPTLIKVVNPGKAYIGSELKEIVGTGSGFEAPLNETLDQLKTYKWKESLTTEECIEVLMQAAIISERHKGVGGPFKVSYLRKEEETVNSGKIDEKKLNMGIYLLRNGMEQEIKPHIKSILDETISAQDLGGELYHEYDLGRPFLNYFEIKK